VPITAKQGLAALATIATIAGGAYTIFQWGKDIGTKSAQHVESSDIRTRTKTYYGYFNDLDKDQKTYLATESFQVTLGTTKEEPRIENIIGTIRGDVKNEQGTMVARTWQIRGYLLSDTLVLSYFTSTVADKGAGVYYLKSKGSNFVGYWIGKDGITGNSIQGPYVLLNDELRPEEVLKKYPELSEGARFLAGAATGSSNQKTN